MFTKKSEQDFFFSYLNENQNVLEYGSGESTLEIAKKVKTLLSLEHQKEWYDKLIIQIPNNTKLILKEPKFPHTTGCGVYDQFEDYINEPKNHNMVFDLIFFR